MMSNWEDQAPWSAPTHRVLDKLDADPETGLTDAEADRRRSVVGENRLRESKPKRWWQVLVDQFTSVIVALLVVAAIVAFAFGEIVEMIAIAAVVIVNAAMGFVTELRAVRSMEALREIAEVSVRVRRAGQLQEIPARQLVPGDIVALEAGNLIGADMRLLEGSDIQADESVLTGESMPVGKDPAPLAADTDLADRTNMLFRGTAVTRGRGTAVVVETGMATEVGRISELVLVASEQETALEHRLDELGKKLVWVCLVLAGMIAAIGAAQGKRLFTVIETAIALAVATIPEGLPIVATIALARGMWRMADRNALIRKLGVVETLGSATMILTDKTGTLTENHMTVTAYRGEETSLRTEVDNPDAETVTFRNEAHEVVPTDDPILRPALEIGLLCNNETLPDQRDATSDRVGEPMEVGLREAAIIGGIDEHELLDSHLRIDETPFSAETKMMATHHQTSRGVRVAVKGAPEAVLHASTRIRTRQDTRPLDDDQRDRWLQANHEMADSGLRVLALAEKYVSAPEPPPYQDLEFISLVGMVDPARSDVRQALDACQSAGIGVVMVTGDQPGTALYVARELQMTDSDDLRAVHGRSLSDVDIPEKLDDDRTAELLETPVFARVTPEQKLNLIRLHQQSGAVVAMTGDGVNDAPALVQADIGIAMGQRGTQVAREAADMVLGDDRFGTIVAAIEQGRIIFENIRKFAVYLLSCNVSELLVISIAALAFPNAPLPLTALQILYLNLVTDVFPALALGVGEGDQAIMDRPPRDPEEPILGDPQGRKIAGYGSLLTAVVLATFYLTFFEFEFADQRAVTISFLTLAFAQLWHVFNMRTSGTSRWNNDVTRNPFVWGALALCVALLAIAVFVPPIALAIKVVDPGLSGWLIALGASLVPLVVGSIRR